MSELCAELEGEYGIVPHLPAEPRCAIQSRQVSVQDGDRRGDRRPGRRGVLRADLGRGAVRRRPATTAWPPISSSASAPRWTTLAPAAPSSAPCRGRAQHGLSGRRSSAEDRTTRLSTAIIPASRSVAPQGSHRRSQLPAGALAEHTRTCLTRITDVWAAGRHGQSVAEPPRRPQHRAAARCALGCASGGGAVAGQVVGDVAPGPRRLRTSVTSPTPGDVDRDRVLGLDPTAAARAASEWARISPGSAASHSRAARLAGRPT